MSELYRPGRSLLVAIAVIATLAIVACRGSGGVAEDAGAKGKALVVVSDSPGEFEPSDVTINVGEAVRWVNTGGIAHSVEFPADSTQGAAASSQVIMPKASYTKVFTTPGTYKYSCRFHNIAGMAGKVVVLANPKVASSAPVPQ
ncbi:MAG TPA: plastocyanin/azurin family copper-binding protein [Candidatus Acidoferrales bacterium]|nr:plastocyanin/azurin family copper-binding protein [Candidatus Acidoferrales bacterium]